MLKRVSLLIFTIISLCASGQNEIDSMVSAAENAAHDTIRSKIYNSVGKKIQLSDPDSSAHYFDLAIAYADQSANDPNVPKEKAILLRGNGMVNLGIAYYLMQEFDKAIRSCGEARELFESIDRMDRAAVAMNVIGVVKKDRGDYEGAREIYEQIYEMRHELGRVKIIAFAANNLGMVLKDQGDFKTSIEFYQIAMDIKFEIGDTAGALKTEINIGLIYLDMKEYDRAMKYFRSGLSAAKRSGAERSQASALNNIGNVHNATGDADSALYYYRKALDLKMEIGDLHSASSTLNNIGGLFQMMGDTISDPIVREGYYDSARVYVMESLKIREEVGDKNGMSSSYNNLGGIALARESYGEAVKFCEMGYDLAVEIGSIKRERAACSCLHEAHAALGQGNRAYKYLKRWHQLDDSLSGVEMAKEVAEQVIQNEYQQKRISDSLQQVQEEERRALIEKQEEERVQTYFIGGGIVGLALIIALVVTIRGLRAKKRANTLLSSQKKEIEIQKDIIEEKNKEVLDSIQYARKIQTAILPSEEQFRKLFPEAFVLFKPRDIVSGDFYWMKEVDGAIYCAVADCTGHGVPGAFVSLVGHNGLNRSISEFGKRSTGEVLDMLNSLVESDFSSSDDRMSDGMDISLVRLKPADGQGGQSGYTIEYSGANNPLWIVRSGSTEIEEIKADKQPIGKFADRTPFNTHTIDLKKGDQIYMFSDGFPDQFGGRKGKKYKSAQLRKLITEISSESTDEQFKLMDEEFEKWRGQIEQIDDVCVIGLRL